MDTKLKSNKSRYIITLILVIIIIGTSIGLYSTYPRIEKQAKIEGFNDFESGWLSYCLDRSNYGIYFDILMYKEKVEPYDVMVKVYEEGDQQYKIILNEEFYRYREELSNGLKNLNYYAIKKDSNLVAERNGGDIKVLLNSTVDSKTIQDLQEKYSFYMVMDYDASGKRTIKELYGADLLTVSGQFEASNIGILSNRFKIKPIENMTYVYAVPRALIYKDQIFTYNEMYEMWSYRAAAEPYITIACFLIIILALFIPYKLTKEFIGFKKILVLPFELICLVIIIVLGATIDSYDSVIRNTINGDLSDFEQLGIGESAFNGVICILYWTICFTVVFIGVIMLKHIFKTGIKQYIKNKSLIYRIFRGILRNCKRFYRYVTDIDLRDDDTKKLRNLLALNLIILTIMSALWFLGIFVAIIYTVILFAIIKKHYAEISNKYNVLLAATRKLAEGNLEITIEEDLGVFNSYKKEIESVQKGFKKAVSEEVKSQNMKTELISNVSHDLKTPLTSIITYVDLLKDENLSEEKRKEYLDTLDRKSQRLQELIEDLFEVSKAVSGNLNLNIVDVDVVSLMKQTLLELEDKILKASLIIKTNYSEEKVILPLDSQRMFRVFENLIINITKYSLHGSRVYIDIISKDDKVQIILRNMSAHEIQCKAEDLAERFVRGDKARSTEGSGLGLAIARSFVELQSGRLDINIDGDLFKVIITFSQKVRK